MAGLELRIEAFGTTQLSRRLLRFGDAAGDMSPAFHRIVDIFAEVGWKQFESEGRYASGGWDPLADATIAAKGNDVILFKTGDLNDSVIATEDNDLTHVKIDPDELEWFSQVPYGEFHMRGNDDLPKRPPWELPLRDRRQVVRELQRELTEAAA